MLRNTMAIGGDSGMLFVIVIAEDTNIHIHIIAHVEKESCVPWHI